MISIPGWIVSVDTRKLILYKIKLKYPQTIGSLSYYIEKGENNATFPFGIHKDDENILYIILRKEEQISYDSCILVGSNVISILKEDKKDFDDYTEIDLTIFLKCYIEFLITTNLIEYTPANLVKTYLGQYSKGRISNRLKPIDNFEFDFPYNVNFKLCEAEEFGIVQIDKNRFLITYVPRFEIYDDLLNLPQNEYTREVLFDKWKQKMILSSKDIIKRFNSLNFKLLDIFNYQNILNIENKKTPVFNERYFSYPNFELKYENPDVLGKKSFSEIYFNEILNYMLKERNSKLTIVFDLTTTFEYIKEIEEFFISIMKFFTIDKIVFLIPTKQNEPDNIKIFDNFIKKYEFKFTSLLYSEIEKIESDYPVIFIINNLVSGYQYLYSEFKKNFNSINKVIHLKTIIKEGNKDLLIGLLFLSLNFRKYRNFLLIDSSDIKPLISFLIQKDFENKFTYIVCSYINSIGKFIFKTKLIPLISYNQDDENLSKEMLQFVHECLEDIRSEFKNQSLIIFFKNSWDILNIIDEGIKITKDFDDYSLVILQNIPLKIFTSNENLIPENGAYLSFCNTKNKLYILLSNGGVDKPEMGTPNPLIFKIINNSKMSENEIINIIYSHSFYHPYSFSKPNLPIEYYLLYNFLKLPLHKKIQEDYGEFLGDEL